MGLFRPYNQKTPDPAPQPAATDQSGKKLAPTPTRKQAEADRMARLHPKLTKKELKAQNKTAKDQERDKRNSAYDDRPQMKLMRQYVDERRMVSEYSWPAMLVLLALSVVSGLVPRLVTIVMAALWTVVLLAIIEIIYTWFGYKKELLAKYPGTSTKGLVLPLASRMITARQLRNPAPTVTPQKRPK